MFPDSKNKKFYFLVLILLLIIAIIGVYNFLYLREIDKNKDIKVINEVTEIKEVEKKIAIPCVKCNAEKGIGKGFNHVIDEIKKEAKITQNKCEELMKNDNNVATQKTLEKVKDLTTKLQEDMNNIQKDIPKENTKTLMSRPTTTKSHIEEINGVKYHHYIVPDSEFEEENGIIKNSTTLIWDNRKPTMPRTPKKPTLMHSFIKKLNPNYNGWIYTLPSFNENVQEASISTEIKDSPLDLVGIYFDKGTRLDDNKYFYNVFKKPNGAENVYYFWRTPNMFEKFIKCINAGYDQSDDHNCPPFAKVLTQEDIDNL